MLTNWTPAHRGLLAIAMLTTGVCTPGLVYKNSITKGGILGGSSARWVSLRLWTPPSIIPRVFWVGHLPHPLSLFTEALSGCVLLPLFTLSSFRHNAKISLWFNSVVNASRAPILRHLEGAMNGLP